MQYIHVKVNDTIFAAKNNGLGPYLRDINLKHETFERFRVIKVDYIITIFNYSVRTRQQWRLKAYKFIWYITWKFSIRNRGLLYSQEWVIVGFARDVFALFPLNSENSSFKLKSTQSVNYSPKYYRSIYTALTNFRIFTQY